MSFFYLKVNNFLALNLREMHQNKAKKRVEARVGIEPTHKGFADLEVVPLTRLFSVFLVSHRCLCRNFVVLGSPLRHVRRRQPEKHVHDSPKAWCSRALPTRIYGCSNPSGPRIFVSHLSFSPEPTINIRQSRGPCYSGRRDLTHTR